MDMTLNETTEAPAKRVIISQMQFSPEDAATLSALAAKDYRSLKNYCEKIILEHIRAATP